MSNKYYCVSCGRPWFGENRCKCSLSRYREYYPGYNQVYNDQNQKKTTGLRFVQDRNRYPPNCYVPGCSCKTQEQNNKNNTNRSTNSESSRENNNSDQHSFDSTVNCQTSLTERSARQWREIYESPRRSKSADTRPPYKTEEKRQKEDQVRPQDFTFASETKFNSPPSLTKVSKLLAELNELEEKNRRKKNRLLIDSMDNKQPNAPPFSGLGSLNDLSKYLDGVSNRRQFGLPLLTDIEKPVTSQWGESGDTCYLDDLELDSKPKKCSNPQCDHEESGPDITIPQFEKVDSLEKIIEIAQTYHCKRNTNYCGIDMEKMYSLIEPLEELQQMIGLSQNKEKIVEQIVFFLKGYQDLKKRDMMHTVITGPPGTGKTTFARIIGKIYSKLGLVSKGHFVEVRRDDLIGKYLGHTAPKTNETIDKCLGGIMFIDEVYSLGHSEKRDSFSKECIDILNQRLSENRDMLCIIAGYKEDIDNCFFNQNKGLKRRFPFIYDIEGYNCEELMRIFDLKITQDNWKIEEGALEKFKERFDKKIFKFYAGDIESFVFKTKICFAQTHFYSESRTIDSETLELVFKQMEDERNPVNEEEKKKQEHDEYIRNTMYL